MTMPRFLDSGLIQEGEALVAMRALVAVLVHNSATDLADEEMLVAMLGMDEATLSEQRVQKDVGFSPSNQAANRRRAYDRSKRRST